MKGIVLTTLATTAVIAGCASGPPARGWSPRPESTAARTEVGGRFVDFTFQDQSGKKRSLRRELGDYTVLAFSKCESDTHQPAVDLLEAIVSDNNTLGNVKVVGVNIHWSESGCQNHEHCHLVEAKPNLGSICDATGEVHVAYGAEKEDWLYLVGRDKTIELSLPATRGAELNRQLSVKVRELSRQRVDDAFIGGDSFIG